MDSSVQQKLARYETFVNESLKKDLQDALDARNVIYDQISEYLKLAKDIEIIKSNGLKEMKTQVDLGSNFYVQAKIPDTQYIYVNVGFGFHAQLTLDEALTFISKKEGQLSKYVGAGSTCPDEGCYADDCLILANAITYFILAWNNRKADVYTQKASQIRAHIKLVLEAMAEIMKLDPNPRPRNLDM
ncbi:hypothetical protein BG003_006139 [Podila horticola]|nr:hypothetical protein BG003_006139 [Podila horticola]